jgi:F-type H+-transporting ATPase subunit delta
MSGSTIARVYAEALFALAKERGLREELDREFMDLAGLFQENRSIHDFFASPGTPQDEKTEIIENTLAPHLHPVTIGFLRLLIHKGREMFIERILDAYQDLTEKAEGRLEIQVTSATPLDEETTTRIADELGRMTGQSVALDARVDPGLIGGLTVRMGDRRLDASIASRLRRLRDRAHAG